MTLEEAVAELNALENPREVLSKYPNKKRPTLDVSRCENCPVALFLHDLTGQVVWVTAGGAVREGIYADTHYSLDSRFVDIIHEFDTEAAEW